MMLHQFLASHSLASCQLRQCTHRGTLMRSRQRAAPSGAAQAHTGLAHTEAQCCAQQAAYVSATLAQTVYCAGNRHRAVLSTRAAKQFFHFCSDAAGSKSGNISNSGGKTKFLIVTTSYGVVFTTVAKR